jgi:exopolysaccharide biosynthesis protein
VSRPKIFSKAKKRFIWGGLAILFAIAFLLYGPFDAFRLLWINTAMYSSRFKFLATSLYSKTFIQSVLDKNKPSVSLKTDTRTVDISGGDGIFFAPIKGNHYTGFIIKIEDPKRLNLVFSNNSQGKLLEDLVTEHNVTGGINASGFTDHKSKGKVWGITIADGVYISHCYEGTRHTMGGFSRDYKMSVGYFNEEEIIEQDYLWAFEFGPLFIVNGEKLELTAYSGGIAPRTAIGQTSDGAVLLVVVDGRRIGSIGATYKDIQTILYANGAINAIGLDGGSSSTMVYQREVVNIPSEGEEGRMLPNAIIFY